MNAAEFKTKWAKVSAKESAAYQSHFDDLCRLLKLPTPLEADPTGDFFCFQKRVVKDAELFDVETPDASEPNERGFADVWKKGCFAWEYKGKKKNLDEAYKQLLRYRESLLNPPLLVVCDFDRYIVKTNFNGTVQETKEFTNDQIDRPENLSLLRAVFSDPDFLKPQRTTAQVTETVARQIADLARLIQSRESVELADAKNRKEIRVAQRKNLRIARFLNRIVFCFFAEDTGLLPKKLFSELLKTGVDDLKHFAVTLEKLFAVMAKGGTFGKDKIRHFNGHLFEESTVFELTEDELRKLAEAGEADWQFIEPSIMGNLFERGLDPDQRAQLGAHYTSEEDIRTLVGPVLMDPLKREWSEIKRGLLAALKAGKGTAVQRERLASFLKKLSTITVLGPACGSGNFLYVSLHLLLDLEKEVITLGTQLGFRFEPRVNVQQLKAIELNAYAFELAQVSVQIGFLQWRRDNGFDNDRSPVLQNLDGFQNEDALLVPHFRSKAKTLKEAQAGEHKGDDALKFYTERDWPKCDVIVSNPPFLGDKLMRGELGHGYVEELRRIYDERIPSQSDLCCYWFEKARDLIEHGKCSRAGLLATQNIRGLANREVLKRIKETGDIFFAESDREWVLAGANVHISMVAFDDGSEQHRTLDGQTVPTVNANLTGNANVVEAVPLAGNVGYAFIGSCKGGPFDIQETEALALLNSGGNPNLKPNSDVVRPVANSDDLVKSRERRWIIDNADMPQETASHYAEPHKIVVERVKPHRDSNRDKWLRQNWWRPQRMRQEMRKAIASLPRFFVTPTTSKHRIFVWLSYPTLPDHKLTVFAFSDDYNFGLLHSHIHEVWALKTGTRLETRPNYTPTTCFDPFPRPNPTPAQEAAIAAAAKELNDLRERWLNPPEWTRTEILEFPASTDGPWSRYVDSKTVDAKTGVGTVRYPRLEPRDADCAAKLKKRTLTNLYNERPAWLDLAHKKLDAAVAVAYGWNDLAEILGPNPPGHVYDFKTKGWLILDCDEKGFIAAMDEFKKQRDELILERLLALNLGRAAEEAKAAKVKRPKAQRTKHAEEMI